MRCPALSLLVLALSVISAVCAPTTTDAPNDSDAQFRAFPVDFEEAANNIQGGTQYLGQACMALECRKSGQPDCPPPPDGYVPTQKMCDELNVMLGEALNARRHSMASKHKTCGNSVPPVESRALDSIAWLAAKAILESLVPWPFSSILSYL